MRVFETFPKPPCAETLGWQRLKSDEDTGDVRIQLEGRPEFCNPARNIQGGLAAMLDDTLGPAVLIRTRGEQDCATIDLRVSFLSAAWPGKRFGEGRIAKIGKTIAFLEGRLRDATGAVIARASASARVVPTRGLARA